MASKIIEVKTLVGKSLKELVKQRNKLRRELFDLKLKNSVKSLTQTSQITLTRKNIARVNTAITQKIKGSQEA